MPLAPSTKFSFRKRWRSKFARHTLAGSRNEVVIFHNHPRNVMNHLLDNQPLASNPDRKMLENLTLNIFQICRQISQGGRVLFTSVKMGLSANSIVRDWKPF